MAAAKRRKSAARAARRAAYRTLIIEAAERVFATKGFDGAKIKDLADAAGLALGTVYAVFPSKRDVFIAVHEARGGALLEGIRRALDGDEAPFATLSRVQQAAVAFYAAHPFYLRLHLHNATSWAAPRHEVEAERLAFERGIELLVAIFERAAARGELIDERPATCARLYLATLQVLLAEWEREAFAAAPGEVAARFERVVQRTFARNGGRALPPARRRRA